MKITVAEGITTTGTKEEFLAITAEMYNYTVTIKSMFDNDYSDTVYSLWAHIYLNCSDIYGMDDYFDTMKEWRY